MSSTDPGAGRPPHEDGLVQLLGIQEERLEPGQVRCRMRAQDAHRNIQGVVHGSVTMALLDTAMGHAVDSLLEPGGWCSTTQISFQFHRAVRSGEELEALGAVTHRGRKIAYVEGTCRNGRGEIVAIGQGAWYLGTPRP
ncbi:MAG: PaaI family thioesterase [Planctomycetes bacterium]|nr:PaaI family thioesterase [Planctomycetota bacterium]MCB9826035.1 PaaI family thioesterase [Planctomycetota bacterium]MCB9829209.1 PaaI family thioesterase [Planctomycetota bacterium]